MAVTKQDIGLPRKPSKLKQYCEDQRERAKSNKKEHHHSHRRKGDGAIYQPYFTELVPLSIFCPEFYHDNVLIKPILGNQQYDAEVIKWGRVLEKIEITKPHDGKAESEDLKLLVDRGYGEFNTKTPLASLMELEPYLEKTAEKKSQKNYQGAVIVFVITYAPPFPALNQESEINQALHNYVALLSRRRYRARKVLMFDSISRKIYSIQKGDFWYWLFGLLVRK